MATCGTNVFVCVRGGGGEKTAAAANFTRDIVVVKRICGQVAKWHQGSQSRKIYTGKKNKEGNSEKTVFTPHGNGKPGNRMKEGEKWKGHENSKN